MLRTSSDPQADPEAEPEVPPPPPLAPRTAAAWSMAIKSAASPMLRGWWAETTAVHAGKHFPLVLSHGLGPHVSPPGSTLDDGSPPLVDPTRVYLLVAPLRHDAYHLLPTRLQQLALGKHTAAARRLWAKGPITCAQGADLLRLSVNQHQIPRGNVDEPRPLLLLPLNDQHVLFFM